MGACHTKNKKKKKNNFGLASNFEKQLDSILEKEYSHDQENPSQFLQNLQDLTKNRIEASVDISFHPERSQSAMKTSIKSPRLKKHRLKRKVKASEESKTQDKDNELKPSNPKAITLKKVPIKTKRASKLSNLSNNSPDLNGDYYEMLDNLDKSHNLISQNLDIELMNEEFKQLKDFVDKKLELLNKKEYQLNLIKNGLQNHYSKETSSDLDMNLLSKKIDKKIKKLNSKTENLNNLNDQLYKFMSNSHAQTQTMDKEGIQKTLDQITHPDPEIHQFQRTLNRENSVTGGLVSPNINYLKKTMKKKSTLISPGLSFPQKQMSHQPSPMLLMDLKENSGMVNSGMLKDKVEKKLEKVEMDNQMLEFLTERLKKRKTKEENRDEIKELITEVEQKIIGKLKEVRLEDLDKDGGVEDSEGIVVWSDDDEPNI